MKQIIAYYRVSTQRQGRSGLGLEAQQLAVASYCRMNGYSLVDEVVEVKSTRKRQNQLLQAMEQCKGLKATLMVARLDRLGRDVEKIARLVKSDVEIVVTDNPHANRFTIHILAAVAEEQRQRISETTKEALRAAKNRGVILGKNGRALALTNKKAADVFAHRMSATLARLRSRGFTTMRDIARELNRLGVSTFHGHGQWHASTVCSLLKRLNRPIEGQETLPALAKRNGDDILFADCKAIQRTVEKGIAKVSAVRTGKGQLKSAASTIMTRPYSSPKDHSDQYRQPIQLFSINQIDMRRWMAPPRYPLNE